MAPIIGITLNGDHTIGEWDTSNVTDMSYMFGYCRYLESVDVGDFDTSSVTNFSYMFHYNVKLTSIDISSFSTES